MGHSNWSQGKVLQSTANFSVYFLWEADVIQQYNSCIGVICCCVWAASSMQDWKCVSVHELVVAPFENNGE